MPNEASLEIFLSHFNRAIAAPNDRFLVANVWSKSSLDTLISDIKAKLEAETIPISSIPSNLELIQHLERIGLAKPLEIQSPDDKSQAVPKLYQIDFGVNASSQPLEIAEVLQAYAPAGVLCYSSAVRYYHLTTQNFSFQHIAHIAWAGDDAHSKTFVQNLPKRQDITPDEKLSEVAKESVRRTQTLGTSRFIYDGIECYTTRRKSQTVPGIQQRILSPRARIRITSFEQTLLDTLSKPFYCGGPAVIFEAWQQYPEKLNQAKLAKLIERIGNDHLSRRAGFMLENFQYTLEPVVAELMAGLLRRLDRKDERNLLPLLPGLPYTSANEKWMLLVP